MMASIEIKYAEIWRVNFEPQVGSEIAKIRPALVISNNLFNQKQELCFILPLTSWQDKFNDRVWMLKLNKDNKNGLDRDSAINCSQIKSFSKKRFLQKLGVVENDVILQARLILNEIMDSSFND